MNGRRKIARREFVGRVSKGLVAAGAVLPAATSRGSDAPAGKIPRVVLGRTGLKVSRISLGTCPPPPRPVFAYCIERGVNFLDSAEEYARGNAEKAIGQLLLDLKIDRGEVVISTKTKDRETAHWPACLEASCERLGTDFVDLFYIHDLGIHRNQDTDLDPGYIEEPKVVSALSELKKSGRIRFAAVSVHHRSPDHTYALIRGAARSKVIDVIMVQYNFRDENNKALHEALAVARKAKVGIVCCKPQGGNKPLPEHLSRYAAGDFSRWQAAIRWVRNDPRIDVVCSNMLNMDQARENLDAVMAPPLEAAELRSLREYAAATECDYCHACMRCFGGCPQGIDIPTIHRAVMYRDNYGSPALARDTYASIPSENRADRCEDCGRCERSCPHGVSTRACLRHARSLFHAVG